MQGAGVKSIKILLAHLLLTVNKASSFLKATFVLNFHLQVVLARPQQKKYLIPTMDKLQLTGLNLGQVFNSRNHHVYVMNFCCYETQLPNLKLKTQPK